MPTENNKKSIHCICPLNTNGIPTPFTSYTPDEALPLSPPITPNHLSPRKQSVSLNIYTPSKSTFDIRSSPSWYMIHATTQRPMAGYSHSICIESKALKNTTSDKELHSFIVNVLDPLFEASPSTVSELKTDNDDRVMKSMWNSYVDINTAYAEAVAQRYNTGDLVWIHDYQLLMVPFYLRQIIPDIKIGLSIYAKFPYWEHLSSIYGHKAMLQSMLQADHIGFQTKLDTRHFATACTQILSLPNPPSSKQICVFPSGIDSQLLIKSSIMRRAKSIRRMFPKKKIIFCRDTHVASVLRTLAAFTELLSKDRFLINNLVLIHLCATNVPASELKAVPELVRQINQLYGNTECVPVHFYHQDIDREEQEALMAASDLGLFLGSQPSTLTVAKEFVVCQHEHHAPLILSNHSPLLVPNGAITTVEDHSNIPALVTALHDALTMCSIDAQKRHEVLYHFILENDASTCAGRFIQMLIDHQTLPLYTSFLLKSFQASHKRLILICDDGNNITSLPTTSSPPSSRRIGPTTNPAHTATESAPHHTTLLPYLEYLNKDPSNSIWIVSGRDQATLDKWSTTSSSTCGLIAEYGAFIKVPTTATGHHQETSLSAIATPKKEDEEWKTRITQLFQKYTQKIPSFFIEEMKTIIKLDYHKSFETEKVLKYSQRCLEDILKMNSEGLSVYRNKAMIQIQKCSSLYFSDGRYSLIQALLDEIHPDMVVCIGSNCTNDLSKKDDLMLATEEAMFSTLHDQFNRDNLFSISIGHKKPTMSNWYVENSFALLPLLKCLSEIS